MNRLGTLAVVLAVPLLVVPPGSAAARPSCHGVPATIVGERDITGTRGDDVIVGSAGDDTVHALGGDDLICGMDGNDTIFDGPGRDVVYGGDGQDGVFQDETTDADVFDGGADFNAFIYPPDASDIYVNLRNDKADDGREGERDRLVNVGSISSGAGDDVLIAGDANALTCHGFPSCQDYYLVAGDGDDLLIGGPRGDLLHPGAGRDVVKGRGGADYVDSIDETVTAGGIAYQPAVDRIDGGPGADQVDCDPLDVVKDATVRSVTSP